MPRKCSRATRYHHLRRLRRALPILAAALAAAGCGGVPEGPPPVFVIAIDAASAAYLGCYGDPHGTTPAIDRLARDAVLFENAYSQSATTVTSTASLLTGLRGISRDLLSGGGLPDDLATLPELAQRAGYRTHAIVGNPFAGAPQLGFHRGYQAVALVYAEPDLRGRRAVEKTNRFTVPIPADINRHALALVEEAAAAPAGAPPPFAYLHYLQPHKPYDPPAAYLRKFPVEAEDPGWDWLHRVFEQAQETGQAPPTAVALIEARYRANLRYLDDGIGAFLDALRERGLYDDALLVLLSDHGEAFMQHGRFGHNRTLYDDMTRIPLLVKLPLREGVRPRRLPQLVETVDVTATLVDYLGLEVPPGLEGESLWPLLAGEREVLREPEVVLATVRRSQRAIRSGPHKYIVHQDGREELYDLASDPGEQRDRSREEPELARGLRARLERIAPLEALQPTADSLERLRADPHTRELLETLGYVGEEIDDENR